MNISASEMIETMLDYIKNFVEKPGPNGFPVCPFAKKARLENKIEFAVLEFYNAEDLLPTIMEFTKKHDILQILHPKIISCEKLYEISNELNKIIDQDLQSFCGHPDDNFNIKGFFTRKDPFPNIQIIWKKLVQEVQNKLPKEYYHGWTEDNYEKTRIAGNSGY